MTPARDGAGSLSAAARAAIEEIEGLAILINNAGTDEFGFFPQTSPQQWQRVIDINLNGVLNCTAAALPGMQEAGYGRIVSISSEAGRVGSKGSAVYSAAKAGVIGFTKVIARENGRYNVTANAIAPGFIETEMLETVPEKVLDKIRAQVPLDRLGRAEEIARVVHFLASDASSYITGQVWAVNGGMDM